MRWLKVDYATAKWDWRTTRQLGQNAARDKRSFVAYAKRAHVSHEEAGFLTCEGTSCDESVSLSSSHPTRRICRPWRHLEPQPLRWHPWSYRSTRARSVKSRKSFLSSRRLPARNYLPNLLLAGIFFDQRHRSPNLMVSPKSFDTSITSARASLSSSSTMWASLISCSALAA